MSNPDHLKVRYVKLHFTVCFTGDFELPVNKVSALRGGMGEMLIRADCVRNRDCEHCDFKSECLVQRIMYSTMEIHPAFMNSGDSAGYVFECEDYRSSAAKGDLMTFSLILFGKTICYFSQILIAIHSLGLNGIGSEHATFEIVSVTNSKKQDILSDGTIDMNRYEILHIDNYVSYRKKQLVKPTPQTRLSVRFRSPLSLKYEGSLIREFSPEALMAAVTRRAYVLACYEGIEMEQRKFGRDELPVILDQEHHLAHVTRFSSRKKQKMTLDGIEGSLTMSGITEEILDYLIYGELVHIGKNTSFGFGRYHISVC